MIHHPKKLNGIIIPNDIPKACVELFGEQVVIRCHYNKWGCVVIFSGPSKAWLWPDDDQYSLS